MGRAMGRGRTGDEGLQNSGVVKRQAAQNKKRGGHKARHPGDAPPRPTPPEPKRREGMADCSRTLKASSSSSAETAPEPSPSISPKHSCGWGGRTPSETAPNASPVSSGKGGGDSRERRRDEARQGVGWRAIELRGTSHPELFSLERRQLWAGALPVAAEPIRDAAAELNCVRAAVEGEPPGGRGAHRL